jgi:hypothetical protein
MIGEERHGGDWGRETREEIGQGGWGVSVGVGLGFHGAFYMWTR